MGQVKESERRLINEAAGYHLNDQPEGDYCDAYFKLKEANENGHEDKLATDFVEVWQPLEYKSVNQILDLIESSIYAIKNKRDVENPIKSIDWNAFQSQRDTLSMMLTQFNNLSDENSDNIDGILNFFDAIEDYAIDVLGFDENEFLIKI